MISGVLQTWGIMFEEFSRADSIFEWAAALGLGFLVGGVILFVWDRLVA